MIHDRKRWKLPMGARDGACGRKPADSDGPVGGCRTIPALKPSGGGA